MRQHRHPSLIRRLLAEHHVYVRGASSSRYVVVSWPWRVGVTLVLVGLLGWTVLASYGWLAAYLETLEQRRELARLAEINHRLEALAEAASAPELAHLTPAPVARIVAQLEEAKAGQSRALSAAGTTAAKAEELPDEPMLAEADAAVGNPRNGIGDNRLAERLLPAAIYIGGKTSGRDWLYDRLMRHPVDHRAPAAD